VSATIREIVNEALTVVGEVTGPGVQVYEEDRMKSDAIRAFNMMFKKYSWPQYLAWFTVTLDGVTGKITTKPFEQVKDFEDFIAVHRQSENYRLPIAPTRLNPFALISGNRPQYWTSLPATDVDYVKKKILIYPANSIGILNILAKVYPLVPPKVQFSFDDSFFLDKDMLVYATAFMTLSGDDLNAGAADVVRNLMEMKYRDVISALASHPIPVTSERFQIPTSFPFEIAPIVPLSAASLQLEGGGFLLLEGGGHLLLESS
jgi:hypothetical protein